ncbi:MAG: MFS transporter [Deltaproteobacteria bacterium]|nr:MFS transporter [Deltaproteobacteria bacterium]
MIDANSSEPGPTGLPSRVWNRSFALLWQGQLVSSAGDVAYQIALGFWLLAETGSTALMGSVMAAVLVPRIVLAPLLGVIIDRVNRKLLLVLADGLSGVSVLLVGSAALFGVLEVWMVLVAGVVVGAASAVFNPTVHSVLPDLVPSRGIVRANAALSTVYSGSGAVGNLAGGVVFSIVGAPLLFLANGVSFLLSALSELFIRVPAVRRDDEARPPVLDEVRSGLRFAWRTPGLRQLYALSCVINFFGTMALFLLLPLFERDAELGAGWYGGTMGAFAVGGLAALLLLSAIELEPKRRFAVFVVAGLIDATCFAALPWMPWVAPMMVLIAISGFATSLENALMMSALQIRIPRQMRGKLFALRSTLVTALVPLAMAAGGALAELVPIPFLITGASAAVFVGFVICLFLPGVREVLGFEG